LKESELRKHAVCSLCKKKILANGLPFFWRVKIERFGLMHAVAVTLANALRDTLAWAMKAEHENACFNDCPPMVEVPGSFGGRVCVRDAWTSIQWREAADRELKS
jgi:hypothetical protein